MLSLPGRAPQGARGLKLKKTAKKTRSTGRAPQGARGLKLRFIEGGLCHESRAPQGARGLKCPEPEKARDRAGVAPRKGRVG